MDSYQVIEEGDLDSAANSAKTFRVRVSYDTFESLKRECERRDITLSAFGGCAVRAFLRRLNSKSTV